jgi:Ion channel
MIRGESEVEELTFRITDRDAKRVVVTHKVQENFLLQCRNVAMHKRYKISTIRMKDLKDLRDKAIEELQSEKSSIMAPIRSLLSSMGFRDEKEQLASLLSRAYDVVSIRQHNEKGWFYYQDFHIYYLKVESRWPWMRSSSATSILIIISFYILSPIFFCYVVQDSDVCPEDPEGYRSYYGWLSSMYFASITLSTVGYGDVTVSKESDWNVFAGIVYMILCNVILILTFSTAADSTTNIFTRLNATILHWVWGDNHSEHLHKKVRRATYLRVGQIICTFFFLNAIGIFASQICIRLSNIQDEEARWNWMTSFYWAVQVSSRRPGNIRHFLKS